MADDVSENAPSEQFNRKANPDFVRWFNVELARTGQTSRQLFEDLRAAYEQGRGEDRGSRIEADQAEVGS